MAKQAINIGSSANDGTGDPLRTAFDKINDNFDELYGSTAEANDLIEDSTPQLGGDLDVNGRRITSARSNEDIILLPNGTGGVVASALRFAGTTISSDDSSSVNINEGLIVDGTASVSGNATVGGTLGVTGVATFTATPVFSADATFSDDISLLSDSAVINFGADSDTTLTHTDGTGLTLNSTNKLCFNDASQFIQGSSATVLSIGATDEIDLTATDIDVNGTMSVSGTLTTASIATTGTHTVTGTAALDGVTIKDNTIASNASNADLEISANGTGKVEIEGVSFFGTTLTAADSSTININEGLVVDGSVTVSGTTNTADVATTGNTTVTGNSTVAGNLTVAGSINADNIISASNGDITIDPAGTGEINLTGPVTHTGTQTTTGQLNVDNLRLDGNVLSATSGAVTLTPADGQNVTVSGTNVKLTAAEANFTLCEATTLRTDFLQSDTSNADLDITTQGTGVVKLDGETQLTLTGSFLPAIHTFTATDAVTIAEHAGRTLLLGEVGGNALVTLTLPAATGSGATYKFIVSVANTSNYVIKVADASDTIDGIMLYLDEDGTAVTAFPTVAASDTITLNGGTTGGIIGDYLELVDIATDQYHVRGTMRVAAGANPATPFSATVS
tara:strand:- start:442 stop:2307 length:1866 start_codon:yes stop_codon:yes gene_type:complete